MLSSIARSVIAEDWIADDLVVPLALLGATTRSVLTIGT
jgi:hypothetical protein